MPKTIVFDYTNYKNETEQRTVVVDRIVWMDDPGYGYEAGWFVVGLDLDRKEQRHFRIDAQRMRPCADGFPISPAGVHILAVVR